MCVCAGGCVMRCTVKGSLLTCSKEVGECGERNCEATHAKSGEGPACWKLQPRHMPHPTFTVAKCHSSFSLSDNDNASKCLTLTLMPLERYYSSVLRSVWHSSCHTLTQTEKRSRPP